MYGFSDDYWNWEDIMKLDIESISAQRSFIFLWCGSTAGLDYGRQCLQKWGFRRCEDICWIKTNLNRGRNRHTFNLFSISPLSLSAAQNVATVWHLLPGEGTLPDGYQGDGATVHGW